MVQVEGRRRRGHRHARQEFGRFWKQFLAGGKGCVNQELGDGAPDVSQGAPAKAEERKRVDAEDTALLKDKGDSEGGDDGDGDD